MEKYTAFDLLFETGLRHMYQAEKAIAEELIKMQENAASPQLSDLFKMHRGETQKQICNLFSIDPRFSIGAGSMIIAVKKGSENDVINRLKKHHVECTVVGELIETENGITIIENDERKALPYLQRDAYWNAFLEAYKTGMK